MNPIEMIENNLKDFSRAELAVANVILDNPSYIIQYNLTGLAKLSHASTAAVIRMCQRIGYEGYKDFKFSLTRHLMAGPTETVENDHTESKDSLSYVANAYIRFLALLRDTVSVDDIKELAREVVKAKRIMLWGINRTGFAATQFSYRLAQLGVAATPITDAMIMNYYSTIMEEGDLCILFTIRGRGTADYKEYMRELRKSGCKVVLITMTPKINLLKEADLHFVLPSISNAQELSFLDDQVIYFVFIETLLHEVSGLLNNRT